MFDVLLGDLNFLESHVALEGVHALGNVSNGKHANAMNGGDAQTTINLLFKMVDYFFLCIQHTVTPIMAGYYNERKHFFACF
jgi:hypothetical protein